MAKKKESKQATLYGGSVTGDYDVTPTDFIRVHEVVKDVGDELTLKIDGTSLNTEKECLTVFDNTDEARSRALTVWFNHHPQAKFTDSTPDGVRFGQAVARTVGAITTNEQLSEVCVGLVLTITGTTFQGGFARLWSISRT